MNTERHSIYSTILSGGLMLTTIFGPGGGYYIDKVMGGAGTVIIPLDNGKKQTTVIPKGSSTVVIDENSPGSSPDYYKVIEDEDRPRRYLNDEPFEGSEDLE